MRRSAARVGGFEWAMVAALLALGTALRCWHLHLGWFGVDQARDVQTALDVADGHAWPTIGPTMRRVTSLGAFYYYFWATPHLLSRDPLAAYGFAAGLGVLTLALAWRFARRFFGGRAALVTLAVLATSRVAVIDGRVAWAPAALPAVAMVLLWLLVVATTAWHFALLGAVLGLAVQLHLTMVAWVVAAGLVVLARRPGWRVFAAFGLGLVATGWPAALAVLANVGGEAGIGTLASRGAWPDVLGRVGAALALGWRVPAAFWQWSDAPEAWPLVTRAGAVLIAGVGVLGLVPLVGAFRRGDRAAAAVLVTLLCQLGVVVMIPGEVWYYYLDATLPLWAISAGALVASATLDRPPFVANDRVLAAVALVTIAAAAWLGGDLARWLGQSARHGYVVLHPATLTLDPGGGEDAPVPGRLVSAGVKRALASALATEPATFAVRWLATHGPAFDDATGDNGFWLARVAAPVAGSTAAVTHAALWHRDDPDAPAAGTPGFELVSVGPLVAARYRPAIDYESCRDEHGPVRVPVRVVPDPRRYGDGTIARPPAVPRRIACAVAAGTGATRVVAAVTAGSVAVRGDGGAVGASGRTSSLCVRRGAEPVTITIETAVPEGAASDLDLYERPDPDCASPKIAP